jgi:hypothetical protein
VYIGLEYEEILLSIEEEKDEGKRERESGRDREHIIDSLK